MALWMEGSCPATDQETADLDAISALKEAAAIELKEDGNKYVKMGRKHYGSALDCYTRAINQNALGNAETSILFSNRAFVNLLLGNYRRALEDSEQAIRLSPDNLKAYYRAAKAAFSLDLLNEAASFCESGIKLFSDNDELKKLKSQIDSRRIQMDSQRNQVSQAILTAKNLAGAIESRGFKYGKEMFRDLTGLRKPTMDGSCVLHWPVLLLYAEVMSSDLIEDFSETDIFSDHLDMMFSSRSGPSLLWDNEGAYTRHSIELYYKTGYGTQMTRKETLKSLMEGTAGAVAADDLLDEDDDVDRACRVDGKWVKVNEKKKLKDILCEPDYIIPGIPVFFVVSKSSAFYKEFKAGNWTPP